MTEKVLSPNGDSRPEKILASALQCFNRLGIAGASISDICRGANASVGSAYHHFGSKQGMAETLLLQGLRCNLSALEERLRHISGAKAGVAAVVESLIEWIADNQDWARFVYSSGLSASSDSMSRQLEAINQQYAGLINAYFSPYWKSGEVLLLPKECYGPLIIGPVHDYARRWLAGRVKSDIRAHKALFAESAWRVVRNADFKN